MPGSYLAQGGVLHAKTMLAYHRDGQKTATALTLAFAGAFGWQGWLWLDTQSVPLAFGTLFALLLVVLGGWLHIHHGKEIARWERRLEQWERLRRDRLIHARHLKGFEL